MLTGYDKTTFTAPLSNGTSVSHDVYTRQLEQAAGVVVILQELPGIGQETLRLADQLAEAGLRVVLPHLFGPLGRTSILANTARVFCMRREFRLFERNAASPITDWLKALCRQVRDDHGVAGVGVIGMCLTGNFAISLMADDAVLAGVASQPSLPLNDQGALHMSDEDTERARRRLDRHGAMLAYRFEGDRLCTGAKFSGIGRAFNDDRERIKLRTLPGKGHSVLTLDFVDADGSPTQRALYEIIAYFRAVLAQ